METQRDPRGVPSGDGAGGRTPHSRLQLQMSDAPSAGWDNTHVWIHHDESGNARLITCVERRTEQGYEYAVVSPYGVEVYDLHDFMAQVNARRQKLQQREEEIQRLRSEAESAYTMLDRYANEVSDEAYRQIESHLIDALDGGGDAE